MANQSDAEKLLTSYAMLGAEIEKRERQGGGRPLHPLVSFVCGIPNTAPPRGYRIVKQSEPLQTGDLILDDENRWRGPTPEGNEHIGRCARDYSWPSLIARPCRKQS